MEVQVWTKGPSRAKQCCCYKLDFSGLAGRAASGGARDEDGSSGLQEGKGTTSSTEASIERERERKSKRVSKCLAETSQHHLNLKPNQLVQFYAHPISLRINTD
ncbi:hypothetical protein pipiens_005288 [Culex pipiens pipiens]|uniref:Uncharacterized protein n=1 Tax=Culex pipiens pipiens TaxID=38569 RepID=A0ABD1DYB4_CULPP